MPPRSPTIVGIDVLTIVLSSIASSIPSITPSSVQRTLGGVAAGSAAGPPGREGRVADMAESLLSQETEGEGKRKGAGPRWCGRRSIRRPHSIKKCNEATLLLRQPAGRVGS
ncbi:hypothetical protein SAV14893_014530 [Streptomyces avermitilis]|uniref:Uncharacterized protein n=1 Tax=Streptomyces avermitilis TaxID=33903 RepID=A0A4D4LRM1_STRAX|nr:hypothetical protein SAVMC3_26670 [Streptomyces avermitilis]GDY62060.1 hypothetical protein SAV14893_014530 [Streptomyces avermitilis]GDY86715.1 hypothetical protein SAVCW2_59140 [Streptomyces avermitilis]